MLEKLKQQLKRLEEFESDEDRIAEIHDQTVLDMVSQIRDRLKDQIPSLVEMQGYARRHKALVKGMWPKLGEPPDVPAALLRPDGVTPFWPDKPPPMELPPPMTMLKPKAGCSMSPSFL